MLQQHTLDQLSGLRLDGMIAALNDTAMQASAQALPFEQRLALLVQRELDWRDGKRVARLLKAAKLKVSGACVEDIDWRAGRGLDRHLVTALADLPYVTPSPPADVTISGYSGTHLRFVVDTTGIDCVMGLYAQDSFIRAADNGQRQDLWILDVAGTRLVIDTATYPDTSADVRAELQAMVDTLLIEPTG